MKISKAFLSFHAQIFSIDRVTEYNTSKQPNEINCVTHFKIVFVAKMLFKTDDSRKKISFKIDL